MVAWRSFSRFDRLLKAVHAPSALTNPYCHLQMGGTKDGLTLVGRHKRQKAVTPIWRPISTQAVSSEGCAVEESKTGNPSDAADSSERTNVGFQVYEVQDGEASCLTDFQNSNQDEPTTGTNMPSIPSISAFDNDNPSKAIEGKQSIPFRPELDRSSDGYECRTDSEADRAHYQKEGETVEELATDKVADVANAVEKHSISVEVDASLIRFVKGKGGSTQKQIEKETGVKIFVPSSRDDSFIVMEGTSVESVTKASEKIASVVEEAVRSPKLDYSHFISLPLAIHPELVEKLQYFQNSILGDSNFTQDNLESDSNEDPSDDMDNDTCLESPKVAVKFEVQDEKEHVGVKIDTIVSNSHSKASVLSDLGIDKSIFIKPKTFHLTVLMLKLWNKDRVAAASAVLQNISSKVLDALDNRPISIKLKGLTCMRGSPAKARVVYAPVMEIGGEGRLLRACQVIIDAYVEAGLVLEKDAQQSLKLHATLMNVRHRKRKTRTRRRDSFDARHIFRVHGSEDWGDYLIREVHLSQRFKFDESGYYHCCSSIPLPEDMQTE